MGKLLQLPVGGVPRRTAIKRFAAKSGLAQADASKMRTCDIVLWLRRNVRWPAPEKAKTGT